MKGLLVFISLILLMSCNLDTQEGQTITRIIKVEQSPTAGIKVESKQEFEEVEYKDYLVKSGYLKDLNNNKMLFLTRIYNLEGRKVFECKTASLSFKEAIDYTITVSRL